MKTLLAKIRIVLIRQDSTLMNRKKLQIKLEALNVNSDHYSLQGELLPDRIVLNHNYAKWEVFYFDERGNRDMEKIFSSEADACEYIYMYFRRMKEMKTIK